MKRKLLVFTSMILVLSMLSGCFMSNNKRRHSVDDDDDDDDDTDPTTEYTVETDDPWPSDYTNPTDDTDATADGKTKYLDTGWAKLEITENDLGSLYTKIIYTEGVPDDFVVYGNTTFGEISKAIKDNNQIRDSISQQVKPFDIEMFRKICTIFWFGPDEYDRMNANQTRQSCLTALAYLATLSFEFTCDNFNPEFALYDDKSSAYEFHGKINEHNIGHCVIGFSDESGNVKNFDKAMCGDTIVWKFDFANPTEFLIGMDADSLESYPTPGYITTANYFGSLIDAAMDK